MPHIPWTSIDNFHNLRRSLKASHLTIPECIHYKAKVKLHGTCSSIRILNDKIVAQSRTNDISVNRDNFGFAAWVQNNKTEFLKVAETISGKDNTILIHGEFAGAGVQKGVALSKLNHKVFAVFAIQIISEDNNNLIINPDIIQALLAKSNIPNLYVLPWYDNGKIYEVNLPDHSELLEKQIDLINEDVKAVEKCDPWVKENFNIEGIGEGLVLYPMLDVVNNNRDAITSLMFKAKGTEHQTVAHTKPAQVDPTVANNINEFVNLVVTDVRCQQGADLLGDFQTSHIANFLKWVGADVDKECQAELMASGIAPKEAMKAVSTAARNWYMDKIKSFK